MVLKKDLTPIGRKGTVDKVAGKGSKRPPPRPMMDQLTRRYPKQAPAPAPRPMPFGVPPEEV